MARTHRSIFTVSSEESAVESSDSSAEWADSTTDSVIVGRLALSNMFNILSPLESADGNRPTIRVGRREIGAVGTGLKNLAYLYSGKTLRSGNIFHFA